MSKTLGKVLFGILPTSTLGLGIWQSFRYFQTEEKAPKITIPTTALDFSKVSYVGPRPCGNQNKRGYYVYVSANQEYLVNLGWSPSQPLTKDELLQLNSRKPDTLQGFIIKGEKGNSFSPENPSEGPFLWVERDKLLKSAGLNPDNSYLVDTYDAIYPGILQPKPKPEPYLTKWTHAGYAATWYSLTFAGIFMMRKMFK